MPAYFIEARVNVSADQLTSDPTGSARLQRARSRILWSLSGILVLTIGLVAVGELVSGVSPGSELAALLPLVAAAVSEAARSGAPLTPQEIRVFEARDWLRGRRVTLPYCGVAAGISEEGKLRIRTADSQVHETLGSVELAGDPG